MEHFQGAAAFGTIGYTGGLIAIAGVAYVRWLRESPQSWQRDIWSEFLVLACLLGPLLFTGFVGICMSWANEQVSQAAMDWWKSAFAFMFVCTLITFAYHIPTNYKFKKQKYQSDTEILKARDYWFYAHLCRILLMILSSASVLRAMHYATK